MKKIFLSILILFMFIFKVDAKEIYYSDYSDFSDYTLEKIESSELVNVEVERRYRFYEEKIVGEYRSSLRDNSSFQFLDLNNKKDSEFTGWSEIKPVEEQNRVIESKTFYKIKRPKPINHISFMNTLNGSLKLNDVEVYYLGEKIDYELIMDNADENFNIYLLGTLTLDLKNYYDLQKITVKVKSIDFKNIDEILILASVPSENKLYDVAYYSYNLSSVNNKNIVIEADDWIRGNVTYESEELLDYIPVNEPLSIITDIKLYRYQDPLFYFYNVERKYIDGYFKEYSSLIKDEFDYRDYYRYQTRDKIEVEDEIVITSYEQKLSDFIQSTEDYEIITNLDINKNGVYQVEYKTSFMTIKKQVLVNILENELKDLKDEHDKLDNELNEVKDQNNELNTELGEVKDQNNKLNTELGEVKDQNNELNTELDEVKDQNNELNTELNEVKERNGKLNNLVDKIEKEKSKLSLELNDLKKDFNELKKDFASHNNKYNDLLNDYTALKQKYQDIIDKEKLENNNCKQKLEEALIKVDDSNKKLKLSEQANKYLEANMLKIGNEESFSIDKKSLFWLIIILILLFVLMIIFAKKMSDKNKF